MQRLNIPQQFAPAHWMSASGPNPNWLEIHSCRISSPSWSLAWNLCHCQNFVHDCTKSSIGQWGLCDKINPWTHVPAPPLWSSLNDTECQNNQTQEQCISTCHHLNEQLISHGLSLSLCSNCPKPLQHQHSIKTKLYISFIIYQSNANYMYCRHLHACTYNVNSAVCICACVCQRQNSCIHKNTYNSDSDIIDCFSLSVLQLFSVGTESYIYYGWAR